MSILEYSPSAFKHAFGIPTASGVLRTCPEDFQVDEILGFSPDGQGEHFLLHIRKRNTNTEWLARQIAGFAGVKTMDVSYAGQKDRNALTTQWFSVRIPGSTEPDWQLFNSEDVQVLDAVRHGRKLRRGSLKGNRFSVVIRNLDGAPQLLAERLCKIKENGVPNYFGEQRFGHNGNNLVLANMMLVEGKKIKNRQKRSMCISAARSYLFNLVCSERVARGSWNKATEGDAMILSGTHSFFTPDSIDEDIQRRINERDIMPSGPLWGKGKLPVHSQAMIIEQGVLAPYKKWCEGLEKLGLKQERRSLWLPVDNLQWAFSDNSVELKFTLPAGSYATSVIREVTNYYENEP